jgi:hypothetical protein
VIRILLALEALQVLVGVCAWWAAPVRTLSILVAVLALAASVLLARDRRWLGGLPRRQRVLAACCWQLPGLLASVATIALILGWRGPLIPIVVLQLWELPSAPGFAALPQLQLHGVPLSLWAAALAPWGTTALVLAATLWRMPQAPRPGPSATPP